MLFLILSLFGVLGQKPQTDAERLVALQLSKECRDAGDKFWQRNGFHSVDKSLVDYVTHYNRREGKCFIRVSSSEMVPKVDSSMSWTVFDAVDGFLIAHSTAVWDGKAWITRSVDNTTNPTPAQIAWFQGLMSD